jgi:hypothetical protein
MEALAVLVSDVGISVGVLMAPCMALNMAVAASTSSAVWCIEHELVMIKGQAAPAGHGSNAIAGYGFATLKKKKKKDRKE